MPDFIIREYSSSDRADVAALWRSAFGDSEDYINAFLDLLPALGTAAVAQDECKLRAMAFALSALSYRGERISYIYAVATEPEYRHMGLGARVSRMAAELSGCRIISTLPAEPGLYDWYADILGTKSLLWCKNEEISAREGIAPVPISADEYLKRRELLLDGRAHIEFSLEAIRLLEKLCLSYGGGLYGCGDSLLAAYADGEGLLIRDAAGDSLADAAASLAFSLGKSRAILRCPLHGDMCHELANNEAFAAASPFIAYCGEHLPEDIFWGIAFD